MCFRVQITVEELQFRAEPVGTEILSCKKNVSVGHKFSTSIAYVLPRHWGADPVGTVFLTCIFVQHFACIYQVPSQGVTNWSRNHFL